MAAFQENGLRPIHLFGRSIDSIFDLLGGDENAMTYALGWCMAKVPSLLNALSEELNLKAPSINATVLLQEHGGKHGITDIEVRDPGKLAWVLEAKAGHTAPGNDQLIKYAERLHSMADDLSAKAMIVLAQSDRRELWLSAHVPQSVLGIPIHVVSWRQVSRCSASIARSSDYHAKALLRDFVAFLERVLGMQVSRSNEVYVVALNWEKFGGGTTHFVDVVEVYRRYFHPVGNGWPINPPNYIAFRYEGILQSIHHVDDYEIIKSFAPHFPDITEGQIEPHFLYHLGPPIRPNHQVRSGAHLRATRLYAHIDLLLTANTVVEAAAQTRARLAALQA